MKILGKLCSLSSSSQAVKFASTLELAASGAEPPALAEAAEGGTSAHSCSPLEMGVGGAALESGSATHAPDDLELSPPLSNPPSRSATIAGSSRRAGAPTAQRLASLGKTKACP